MGRTLCSLSAICLVAGLGMACPPPPPDDFDYYTPPVSVCGNDRKQKGERCDGTDLNDKTCEALGFGPGALSCLESCDDFDRRGCGAPEGCGDGVQMGVELCDGADLDGETCETLGLGPGLLLCNANCGNFDTALCAPPPDCGDGKRRGAELCDGEDFGAVSCEALGYRSGALWCSGDCLSIDESACSYECIPDCSGRSCGPDPVCGESCGSCAAGTCVNGTCQVSDGGPSCPETMDCAGRACGPDPVCGLSCGSCSSGTCNGVGQCETTTVGCAQGYSRCSSDGYGFEACGENPSSGAIDYGPRVPCSAGQSCSGGACNRSGCLGSEVIVLLDRSSSMLEGDIWSWVRDATLLSIYARDRTNSFGFRQFPSGSGCSVGGLTALARNNAPNIHGSVSDPTTGASTPIEAALQGLGSAFGDPNDGQAVILISDGDETCGSAAGAVAEASALFRAGVLVHTIAVTTAANRGLLDEIARVGGTGQSRLVADGPAMVAALDAIYATLDACADCTGAAAACSGDTITFCDGADMQTANCADYGAACRYHAGAGAARCLGGVDAPCGDDPSVYINVCDPSQSLSCNVEGYCVEEVTGTQQEGDLYIAGGGTSGRLLVWHQDSWGTVCDDDWGSYPQNADVACRQIFGASYTGSFGYAGDGSCTAGYDPLWLDSVNCVGDEARLVDCPHDEYGVHDCSHDEDVCLTCTVL